MMKNIIIQTTSQTPIYQQIHDQLASQIMNGNLKPDTLLPSIRQTAKELRVSIITIKKAWELLESNDYIYTVVGKGSYVKNNTSVKLNKMKQNTIKDTLQEGVLLGKQLGLSKEELVAILEDLYNK